MNLTLSAANIVIPYTPKRKIKLQRRTKIITITRVYFPNYRNNFILLHSRYLE